MEDLKIHSDNSSTGTNLAEAIEKATAAVSAFDIQHLPGPEMTAATATVADTFDIAVAAKASMEVAPEESAALKRELQGCGRALKSAKRQETKSRENYHLAIARIWLTGTTALSDPKALVALAVKKKIPTTRASWKNPHLVLLKLINPSLDDKTASQCARALNFVSAAGVPADKVAAFIAEHGIVALARAEAERQKLRKSGGAEKPPVEDPLQAFHQELTPVALPTEFGLEGLPENEGDIALMIVGRREGQVLAWAVDSDEKALAASIRRVLKRTRAATPAAQEDATEED